MGPTRQPSTRSTGKEKLVELVCPGALKTIYWANVNTAYAAGEWERTWRTRRVLPYLEYLTSTAEHKRLEHLAWVGTVLPVEHIWWNTHYPPNGWECQCRVRQLSAHEAKTRPRYGDTPGGFWRARLRELAHWRRRYARAQRHPRRAGTTIRENSA